MIWVHKLNFETWILTISLKLPRVWILLNISLPFFLNIVLHYWNQTGTCLNTWIKIFSLVFSFSLFVTLLTREMFQFCLLTDMPLKVSISISRMRYSTKHQPEFFFMLFNRKQISGALWLLDADCAWTISGLLTIFALTFLSWVCSKLLNKSAPKLVQFLHQHQNWCNFYHCQNWCTPNQYEM